MQGGFGVIETTHALRLMGDGSDRPPVWPAMKQRRIMPLKMAKVGNDAGVVEASDKAAFIAAGRRASGRGKSWFGHWPEFRFY